MEKVNGWVIVHPGGQVEIDYFHTKRFTIEGKRASRAEWLRTYRPRCRMVRATLHVPR